MAGYYFHRLNCPILRSMDLNEPQGIVKAFKWLTGLPGTLKLKTQSPEWQEILADVIDWTPVNPEVQDRDADAFQVRGTLAFMLNGERHYGVVLSQPLEESRMNDFLASANKPKQLLVRYDPANPDEMVAVRKYGDLPFNIWLSGRNILSSPAATYSS
jgi:hypothetical protein